MSSDDDERERAGLNPAAGAADQSVSPVDATVTRAGAAELAVRLNAAVARLGWHRHPLGGLTGVFHALADAEGYLYLTGALDGGHAVEFLEMLERRAAQVAHVQAVEPMVVPGLWMRGPASGGHADRSETSPVGVTPAEPARVYDALLGGRDNYAADAALAEQMVGLAPQIVVSAQTNRAFVRRAVAWLALAGIGQFLDIGSGIPARGNVTEVVRAIAPGARVVSADLDEVVVARGRAQLVAPSRADTAFLHADLRDPYAILAHPDLLRVLDLGEPVAVVLGAVAHFLTDAQDPAGIIATLMRLLVPGSALVLSHATADLDAQGACAVAQAFNAGASIPITLRSHAQISRFFAGLELVEPGLVPVSAWHREAGQGQVVSGDHEVWIYGAVAVKSGGDTPARAVEQARSAQPGTSGQQAGGGSDSRPAER